MKKVLIFSLFLLVLLISYPAFSQETLTLTTYYPSPIGVYNRLVTTTLGVGDQTGDGLDANDSPDPNTLGQEGDVWIAGDVGIGTTDPKTKLDVEGEVKIGNTGIDCNSDTEGTTRYNSTDKVMEYCDASTWNPLGGGFPDPDYDSGWVNYSGGVGSKTFLMHNLGTVETMVYLEHEHNPAASGIYGSEDAPEAPNWSGKNETTIIVRNSNRWGVRFRLRMWRL